MRKKVLVCVCVCASVRVCVSQKNFLIFSGKLLRTVNNANVVTITEQQHGEIKVRK